MRIKEQKTRQALLLGLLIWLCLLWITTSVLNLYKNRYESSATIKSSQTSYTQQSKPTPEILGIYNSVTLTPTPEILEQSDTTKSNSSNKAVIQNVPISINKQEVYTQINEYRTNNGLQAINIDNRLESSALNKARDMVTKNYFDHGDPWSFISASGYKFKYASENLAVNYYSSSSLVRGWKDSPSHNQAMLDDRNKHMGFAYLCNITISNYQNTCLAVIHFGSES